MRRFALEDPVPVVHARAPLYRGNEEGCAVSALPQFTGVSLELGYCLPYLPLAPWLRVPVSAWTGEDAWVGCASLGFEC